MRCACWLILATSLLPVLTGCASLSLFGSTHKHTHHHNEPCTDCGPRIDALEARVQNLESQISGAPLRVPSEPSNF